MDRERQGLAVQAHADPAAQDGQAGSPKLFQPSYPRPSSCTWERGPPAAGEGVGQRRELRTDTPGEPGVSQFIGSFIHLFSKYLFGTNWPGRAR